MSLYVELRNVGSRTRKDRRQKFIFMLAIDILNPEVVSFKRAM